MKNTILCVDDEIDNVDALERLFRKKYHVLKATSGPMALQILSQHPEVKLIISDQRMPEMSGVELLEKSLQSHPDCTRILLTGYTDVESVIAAINAGQIYRYVTKPWDPVDLMNAVDRGIERVELSLELKQKNKELEAALTELKSLDEAKNHFMILINHELKTPLTSIISFLGLLKESSLDSEQSLFVQRIDQSATKLKSIIDDVLIIVSSATGQMNVNASKHKTNEFTNFLSSDLQSQMKSKSQSLACDLGEYVTQIDKNKIQEVLSRLLQNAIRFGNEESQIQVQAEDLGDKIEISVFNYGPLIPDQVRKRVLEPFTLNEDIMKHSKGTGLGLSVSQALLRSLNSELKIQNTTRGVKVSFHIPKIE